MTYVGFVTSQWYCVPFKTLLISYYFWFFVLEKPKPTQTPKPTKQKSTTKLSVQKMAIQSCAFIQVPSQIKLLCILTVSSVVVKPAGSAGYRWVCWGEDSSELHGRLLRTAPAAAPAFPGYAALFYWDELEIQISSSLLLRVRGANS